MLMSIGNGRNKSFPESSARALVGEEFWKRWNLHQSCTPARNRLKAKTANVTSRFAIGGSLLHMAANLIKRTIQETGG